MLAHAVELLLLARADPGEEDARGETPAQLAARSDEGGSHAEACAIAQQLCSCIAVCFCRGTISRQVHLLDGQIDCLRTVVHVFRVKALGKLHDGKGRTWLVDPFETP